MKNQLRIILLGSGPMAARLAKRLKARGHWVEDLVRETPEMWDREEMDQVGLRDADLAIAITGRDDSSLALALAARRIYGTPALAVVSDPGKDRTYQKCSLPSIEVVCATTCAEQSILNAVEFGCPPKAPSGSSHIRTIVLWVLAVVLAGVVWPLFLYFYVLPERSPVPLHPRQNHDSENPPTKRHHAFLDTF